jgi:hypothetical protein
VFQPAARTVTLVGLGPEGAFTQSSFRTTRSEHVVAFVTSQPTTATRAYLAIPDARLQPGDVQALLATTAPTEGHVRRTTALYFRTPADRTLTLGALPIAPTLAIEASAPTLRPRARLVQQADYDRLTSVAWQQGPNTIVTVSMTPEYAARSTGGYDLIVPELTGVSGFDPAWALRAGGGTLLWTVGRIGGSLGLATDVVPKDGDTRRGAGDGGVFTP